MKYCPISQNNNIIFKDFTNLDSISKKNYEKFLNFLINHRLYMDIFPKICNQIKNMERYDYYEFIYMEKKKNLEKKIDVIKDLQKILENNNLQFVFLKLEKYPNLGKDIDILIEKPLNRIINLLKNNGWIQIESVYYGLFNRHILVNKENNIKIDLYSEYSRFHENWFKDTLNIIQNRRIVSIDRYKIYCPSLEDSFIIHLIASFYLNGTVDFCTLKILLTLYSNSSYKENIMNKCKTIGILEGAKLFFHFSGILLNKNLEKDFDKIFINKYFKKNFKYPDLKLSDSPFKINVIDLLDIFLDKIKKELIEYNFINAFIISNIFNLTQCMKLLKYISKK